MTTLIYTHAECLEHRPGPQHPESPARLAAVLEALKAPEFTAAQWREAPLGTLEQVRLVHDDDYVELVRSAAPKQGLCVLDAGDTVMSPGTLNAVLRCVGAACAGVDAVVTGEADNVFCATRPCGHHAEADRAMGFCVFNQAAIAALHAREAHGLQRIAVVDFDVHHGNGTQSAFYDDPRAVLRVVAPVAVLPRHRRPARDRYGSQHRQRAARTGRRLGDLPRPDGGRAAAGVEALRAGARHRSRPASMRTRKTRSAACASPTPTSTGSRANCRRSPMRRRAGASSRSSRGATAWKGSPAARRRTCGR